MNDDHDNQVNTSCAARTRGPSGFGHSVKRIVDFCAALIGLLLLLPVIVAISLVILLKMGSPIFFRQLRPGYSGNVFLLYKFRTMCEPDSEENRIATDGQRLTGLGRFLRRTSMDEIPQLWNVLKGEMSLVGPRPLLVEYLPLYNAEQARRHDVRPGITGWAQVNGRNAIFWEEKFALDTWYVDNWSFSLDLKILVMTVLRVFCRSGVNQAGQATAMPFTGAKSSAKSERK